MIKNGIFENKIMEHFLFKKFNISKTPEMYINEFYPKHIWHSNNFRWSLSLYEKNSIFHFVNILERYQEKHTTILKNYSRYYIRNHMSFLRMWVKYCEKTSEISSIIPNCCPWQIVYLVNWAWALEFINHILCERASDSKLNNLAE